MTYRSCSSQSRFNISMAIQSCLDNVGNAHVRFAAEIPLPLLSRLIVGMVLTARGSQFYMFKYMTGPG